MNDKRFLQWILDRLIIVYGEDKNVDFVCKLRGIVLNTDYSKNSHSIQVK